MESFSLPINALAKLASTEKVYFSVDTQFIYRKKTTNHRSVIASNGSIFSPSHESGSKLSSSIQFAA